jgi:hypothetical protein
MEDFEQELRRALERRPAPPNLKGKIMQNRRRPVHQRGHAVLWQRLAAAFALAAVLGGAARWQEHVQEERRQGEAARRQVLTALRITGHALNQMNAQLAAHSRTHE